MDKNFFIAQKFFETELKKYKQSAKRGLDIAGNSNDPEVMFHFSFMALIKIGIYSLAKAGYRVKSQPGHHQKIIEYLSQNLASQEVLLMGDKMRKERNLDFYGVDFVCSNEEARAYFEFINTIFKKI